MIVRHNKVDKILSKCIYVRIKDRLDDLIAKDRRLIVDNILLAHELTHGLNYSVSVDNLIMKVDMDGAYDKLEWQMIWFIM